jgi:hypothetical protein
MAPDTQKASEYTDAQHVENLTVEQARDYLSTGTAAIAKNGNRKN